MIGYCDKNIVMKITDIKYYYRVITLSMHYCTKKIIEY